MVKFYVILTVYVDFLIQNAQPSDCCIYLIQKSRYQAINYYEDVDLSPFYFCKGIYVYNFYKWQQLHVYIYICTWQKGFAF